MRKFMSIIAAAVCFSTIANAAEIPFPVQSFEAPDGGQVSISMINHGSIAISYKDVTIQIDPVGNYGRKAIDYGCFPKADAILVSHEHGDHLDAACVKAISKENTKVICNAASASKLDGATVLANGGSINVNGVEIKAVPAYNYSEGHTQFHPKGNGNGYVLTVGGLVIYVAGDTEDIPELDALKGIDVAFLPVNQPYTMTVDQCIKATRTICPKVLVPYHLGNTDVKAISNGLAGSGTEVLLFDSLK